MYLKIVVPSTSTPPITLVNYVMAGVARKHIRTYHKQTDVTYQRHSKTINVHFLQEM